MMIPVLLHMAGSGAPVRVFIGPGVAYHQVYDRDSAGEANPTKPMGSVILAACGQIHVRENLNEIDLIVQRADFGHQAPMDAYTPTRPS